MALEKLTQLNQAQQASRADILHNVKGSEIEPKYWDIFKRGAEQERIDLETGAQRRVYSTVGDLAARFVDEYIKKTGRVPTESQVVTFLGTTIDTGFAARSFKGELPPETVQAQIIEPAVAGEIQKQELESPETAGVGGQQNFDELARSIMAERTGYADQLAKLQLEEGTQDIDRTFGDERRRAIREESALGRLGQPVSADFSSPISRVDEGRRTALGNLIRSVQAGQIGVKSGIQGESLGHISQAQQFGADLRLRKQGLLEQIRQYNVSSGLEKEKLRLGIVQQQREIEAAERLGKLQAEASQPGTLDYISTAFSGLGALTGLVGAGSRLNQPASAKIIPRANVTSR